MQLANGALNKIVNRPFILIFSALLSMAYCLVDMSNPITAVMFGFSAMGGGDVLGTAISLIQLMLSPALLLKVAMWIILGIVILSLAVSFLFSGYFYILHNTIEDRNQQKGEFIAGVSRYFKSVFKVTATLLILGTLFMAFLTVVAVPALFTTWSWKSGKTELFGMMILLDTLTVAVTFFALMFFRLYTFYWYPATYSFESYTFRMGKRIVDNNFWVLVGRWVIIDLIFIVFELAFLFIRYKISLTGSENTVYIAILFAGKFLFTASFFTAVTAFLFASFKSLQAEI